MTWTRLDCVAFALYYTHSTVDNNMIDDEDFKEEMRRFENHPYREKYYKKEYDVAKAYIRLIRKSESEEGTNPCVGDFESGC